MTPQNLNAMRMILFAVIVLLLLITVYSYFQTGKFNFSSVFIALGCLLIFLVTKKKITSNQR